MGTRASVCEVPDVFDFQYACMQREASDGWADIYLQHPALVGLVTPVLRRESKCQGRLVAACYPHRWAFFILRGPYAALHLGNSGEK